MKKDRISRNRRS